MLLLRVFSDHTYKWCIKFSIMYLTNERKENKRKEKPERENMWGMCGNGKVLTCAGKTLFGNENWIEWKSIIFIKELFHRILKADNVSSCVSSYFQHLHSPFLPHTPLLSYSLLKHPSFTVYRMKKLTKHNLSINVFSQQSCYIELNK